jgi:hypothetical protein
MIELSRTRQRLKRPLIDMRDSAFLVSAGSTRFDQPPETGAQRSSQLSREANKKAQLVQAAQVLVKQRLIQYGISPSFKVSQVSAVLAAGSCCIHTHSTEKRAASK